MKTLSLLGSIATAAGVLVSFEAHAAGEAKNVIFFLGDGMGVATVTASRIYRYGESGQLNMEKLPHTAQIKTYSENAMTTDSAPSMSAYMTGNKMKNGVLSCQTGTNNDKNSTTSDPTSHAPNTCTPVTTLLELAKASSKAVGVVTTTRVTHATPAATYSHITDRDSEFDISRQLDPASTLAACGSAVCAFNAKLAKDTDSGLDVVFGGGLKFFKTSSLDLTADFTTAGYSYVTTRDQLVALTASSTSPIKALGLFNSDHMSYEIDRGGTTEPSLLDMTDKAVDLLLAKSAKASNSGLFLMVEGGRIDHALHATNARRALEDTVAFDDAIGRVLARLDASTDPNFNWSNTLVVVTADHDHTMAISGYSRRTGPTTSTNAGILGWVFPNTGDTTQPTLDADGLPYTILGFGNGWRRPDIRSYYDFAIQTTALAFPNGSVIDLTNKDYVQLSGVRLSSETHGGTDVLLMAKGAGSAGFKGTIENTAVFGLVKTAFGFN